MVEYHHIIPYSIEAHFRASDMMCLCPNCHHAATVGALSESRQRILKGDPVNKRMGFASGALISPQEYCAVRIGGVLLVGNGPLISVDGEPLLSLNSSSAGELLVSLRLYDEEDNILALIEENEWISGDPAVWDLEAKHHRLRVRQRKGLVNLAINTVAEPADVRARLWWHGQLVDLRPTGIVIGSGKNTGGFEDLGLAGLKLNINSVTKATSMEPIQGNAFLISEEDPIKRFQRTVDAWYGNGQAGAAFRKGK